MGLRETIHHTTEERDHFRKLLELGMVDSFRLFEQPEKSFSWWDYRMLGYQKNRGLRIDHILVSDGVKAAVVRAVEMPRDEARRRMKTLRRHVKRHDVDRWAHGFLDALGMPT